LKTYLHPDNHTIELRKQWPRKFIPINIPERANRGSHWMCTSRWIGIGKKPWARAYSNTLNDYMKSMFTVDPQCRPSAVELQRKMRLVWENGMKIAQIELEKEWSADAVVNRGIDPAVLLAFDALLMKDDPESWKELYPYISLQT
jgi:hypothetical protein